ncbi:MAG: DUF5916 domain-containing protein [Myxococcales bacterium]
MDDVRRVLGILLATVLCAPGSARAAPPRAEEAAQYFRAIHAVRRQGPINLDGRPDEPAWLEAELGNGFRQFSPDEGAPPSVETRFRVLWDDDAIYLGVECDDPLPPTALLSRRDRPVDGDYISFDLDTTNDRRTAYHFQVFAGGHQLDALHFNDTDFTADWDAAWESAVAVSDRGWSVEVRIPLRILRIPEGARSFGFNIYRILARRHEEDQWRYRPHGAAGDISMLGELTGLGGIRPVRSLELRPYFATRSATTRPAPANATATLVFDPCLTVGYTTRSVAGACAGLDLRYSIASDVSLVGTLNPDFGQVEADQRVLNLSTFETFFPEKRPFFTEGLDLFQSPLRINFGGPYGGDAYQIFYSRRIGRPPPAWSDWDGDKGVLVYQPAARPVLAAWKLTGTAGPSSFGLLTSYEPRVEAQSVLQGTHVSGTRVAEAVHSAALRVRTPITSRALLGVFATAVDPIGASPSLALPDSRHAHVAGADFVTYDAARDWSFTTQGTGSFLTGGTPDVQPDGTVLASGSSGAAASAKIAKDAGPLVGFAGGDWLSPQFTVNDLGFMRRANLLRGFGYLQLRDVHPNSVWQRAFVGAWAREVRNAQGSLTLDRDTGFETFVLLNSQWSFGHAFLLQLPYVDDRELGDGTPLERQRSWVFNPFFNSDSRKAVSYGGYMDYGRSGPHYERLYDFGGTLNVRPLPQLETNLELSFLRTDGTIRQIRTASEVPSACGTSCGAPPAPLNPATATQHERLYLVAPQSSRSVSLTGRGTYAFSPRLTLQLYAQLFGAGISYGSPLRAVAAPGKATVRFSDMLPARPEDVPPDADDRQAGLNVNLILRWEWRLGSTLYLVYAHQSSSDFVPSRRGLDFSGELSAFGARGAVHGDTFLVKVDLFEAL